MSDLVTRLYAAIDEREAKANAAIRATVHRYCPAGEAEWSMNSEGTLNADGDALAIGTYGGGIDDEVGAHIVANDPAAVLRMCEAHRKIVEHAKETIAEWMTEQRQVSYAQCAISDLDVIIRLLAEGYGLTTEEEVA